ncbi:DUF2569 domain-containing protein [Sphingomicrobium lutaoense]|uniref:DUF2569 domain-containing protein n=1 Tax=Sphingomicrobium lutaoense TaxID=515949 RepID=A0A839Z3N2_9SPHN|nr:DUF2569 domain-containing protein [Sphingomicrobium lutaoense]MBB3764697.1 hypothetical protein [Sphingomicrobium lutaoense]
MITAYAARLHERSHALLAALEGSLRKIMLFWLVLAMGACSLRVVAGTAGAGTASLKTALPYILLAIMPLVSMGLALRWFRDGADMPQPEIRLARAGAWKKVSPEEARAHPLYGTSGIMVSLLIGTLLNVPVRSAEYLVAIPAITEAVPGWLSTLHFMMTLDVVLLSSLYTIAFVAALRKVPLFPRLLVAIWMVDLAMQLAVAQVVSAEGLPATVAAPLHTLLDGNVKKVMISIFLWAPYLLLSKRVNVTYRQRVEA